MKGGMKEMDGGECKSIKANVDLRRQNDLKTGVVGWVLESTSSVTESVTESEIIK